MPTESFDFVFCASGLVLMRDIPIALRRWASWLRPKGYIAFDVPAKPFGISQMAAEAAAEHGVLLKYDNVANSLEKCRALLEHTGFEATLIRAEKVSDDSVELEKAIAFFDERLDHPAWRALKEASKATRGAIREAYIAGLRKNSVANLVPNEIALNFVYGQKL